MDGPVLINFADNMYMSMSPLIHVQLFIVHATVYYCSFLRQVLARPEALLVLIKSYCNRKHYHLVRYKIVISNRKPSLFSRESLENHDFSSKSAP